MLKKIAYIFFILFVSTSLIASDRGETAGSEFDVTYSTSGDFAGSKLEKTSSTGDDSAGSKVEKSQYRMIIYPYFGGGISFAEYKAWSGSELGLFLMGDPTLFKNDEYAYPVLWGAGVMVDYFISGNLAFTCGLSYDHSEFRTEYLLNGPYGEDLTLRVDFNFLTVPVGVHYYFSEYFLAGGGLYLGRLISDDFYVNDESGGSIGGHDDIGIFLDMGLNFNITDSNSIMAFVRYKHGLVKVYDEEDIVTDIKLRTVTVNLAMGFRL